MTTGIIVAAGKGERMGMDKAFLALGTQPVLAYSLRKFQESPAIQSIVLVVRNEQLATARGIVQLFGISKIRDIVKGGRRRQDSVKAGLKAVDPDSDIVVVHDAARPCVSLSIIADTVASAAKFGSGVAAYKVVDTLKSADRGHCFNGTVDRTSLWAVQTPQAFRLDLLQAAFEKVDADNADVTDESSAVELLGEQVRLVPSTFSNMKITTPDDIPAAAALLGIH